MKNNIDITNQSEVLYTFANSDTTNHDNVRTKRLLQKAYNYLEDFLKVKTAPSSVSILRKNNRNCRIIVYDFKKLLSIENIFVVVFFGNKRENLLRNFTNDFFHTDWEIAMSLIDKDKILSYISQELSDGNWFNIVLFTEESGKKHITTSETHKHAAYTLAPKRFSWVRLHNAVLPKGIRGYENIVITKTKYYNFDTMWFATRNYCNI